MSDHAAKQLHPNGVNHLAIATADIKTVLQFFNDVLGMPLAALYWMHYVENTVHGFLTLNENSLLAFVFSPEIPDQIELGVTHSGHPGTPCAKGTMQHLALNVDSMEDLLAMRSRIRSRGVHCFGPIDHGLMQSIYFAGPDGMTLEVTFMTGEDPHKWIDPEVVDFVGFSEEEMQRMLNPETYEPPAEPVPNPPKDASQNYRIVFTSDEEFEAWIGSTDEEFTEMTRDNIPPTKT